MSESAHHFEEEKTKFQLERLILFSDAVFAIAITLLVIEIRVPEIKVVTTHAMLEVLSEKLPEFFAFALSFAVIGQFWISHHRLFGLVTGYTTGLIWLNLLMLFWIVLVPFTSGLNSRYGGQDITWIIYSLNLFMISISLYFIYRYAGSRKRGLSLLANNRQLQKYTFMRSAVTSLIFLSGALFCLLNQPWASWTARAIYFVIPLALVTINRRARRASAAVPPQPVRKTKR